MCGSRRDHSMGPDHVLHCLMHAYTKVKKGKIKSPTRRKTQSCHVLACSYSVRVKELLVDCHVVDALLSELECGEEDGVDYAGTRHGNTKATVHSGIEELDLGSRLLVSASDQTVALVD